MITQDPESKILATGVPVAFTVEATGDNLQFQWQKDCKRIDVNDPRLQCSHTDKISTLFIHCLEKGDIGHYKCLVKNPAEGSGKTSQEAKLIVCEFVCILLTWFSVHVLLCLKGLQ